MIRELFAALMLLFEPVALPVATGFFLFSFSDRKNRKKRQKIAWGILLAVILQAMVVVLAAMLYPGS